MNDDLLQGHVHALSALVGSHNYNLDTPVSDEDFKHFAWPTFDDLLLNRRLHRAVVTDEEDFTVHDVRVLPEQFRKANVGFLEVLFSRRVHGDAALVEYLATHGDAMLHGNLPGLFTVCMNAAAQKARLMLIDSPARRASIAAHGYDAKNACHAVRLHRFIDALPAVGWDFAAAAWCAPGAVRDELLAIKAGAYTLADVQRVVRESAAAAERRRPVFEERPCTPRVFDDLAGWLNDRIRAMLARDGA